MLMRCRIGSIGTNSMAAAGAEPSCSGANEKKQGFIIVISRPGAATATMLIGQAGHAVTQQKIFTVLAMNLSIKTSFPMPPRAQTSGAERQSRGVENTEPTGLEDLWEKYHRATEIHAYACVSADGTALPDEVGHG
jgi:hypothetical protein